MATKGRPRSFDCDDALDAALTTFWRHGFSSTSLADLTTAMRINPPSLYAAFGSKRELFDKAVERYTQRLYAAVRDELDAPTAREAIERLLIGAAYAHTEPDTPRGCFAFSEPCLGAERMQVRDMVAERAARAQIDGDVPAEADPRALADFIDVVIAGMSTRARDGASRTELLATAGVAVGAWPRLPEQPPRETDEAR